MNGAWDSQSRSNLSKNWHMRSPLLMVYVIKHHHSASSVWWYTFQRLWKICKLVRLDHPPTQPDTLWKMMEFVRLDDFLFPTIGEVMFQVMFQTTNQSFSSSLSVPKNQRSRPSMPSNQGHPSLSMPDIDKKSGESRELTKNKIDELIQDGAPSR